MATGAHNIVNLTRCGVIRQIIFNRKIFFLHKRRRAVDKVAVRPTFLQVAPDK